MGRDYNKHLNLLKNWEKMDVEIVGITDKNLPELNVIDDWTVYKTDDIREIKLDYILVMSEKFYFEIVYDILELGIDRKKILPCKILNIPYFDWGKYIEIQQKDLSIICNNCVGGILYNTLAMECKSPCKNLAIPDNCFLKFANQLEHYMKLELEFLRWQIDPHSNKRFPVMKLDDIEIWCNHDFEIETAIEKWNRRKQKINYENIVFLMYTENDEIGRRFLEEVDGKKVLFVPENSTIEDENYVWKLKLFPGQKEFWEVVNSSAALGKNNYNYKILDMLNGKKDYRY